MNISSSVVIRTPEGVEFPLHLADPASRGTAFFIDLFAIAVCQNVIKFLSGFIMVLSFDLAIAFQILLFFATHILYFILLEWCMGGRTIGKKVMKLQVIDADGISLQFHQIVIRNLLRFVDMMPAFYAIGAITAVISKKYQRLGDIAAQTIVVKENFSSPLNTTNILKDKYNSLRKYPQLIGRLKQKVSIAEASLALNALLRRDELDPDTRHDIYKDLADHFRELCPFPQDVEESISDERYLRNIVDLLFSRL